VDTVSIDKSEPYTTLSYTWGLPGTVLKTTDDNIAAHKNSIPLSTEYKTLEDAIYVTRSMGVKYIWIDSLCIIQDQLQKPSDFDIEGQHMKEIYSNSIFTIAASRGQGTGVSCFASRTSDALIKPQRFFPAPSSNNMYSHSYYFIVDHNIWSQAVTDAALNMRGWVFQERLLAPRTMHFCDDQIFWECREFAACEAFPWGLPSKLTDQDGGFLPFEKHGFKSLIGDLAQSVSPAATASSSFWSPRPQQSLQDPDGWSITLNRWHQVVEAYTKRGLTKPADKVVAIAGIAQKFKPVLHDKFVAGLWDNLIIYELAWTVHYLPGFYPGDARPIDPQTGQKIYCGPTWSWVSLNRHVEYKLGPNIHQWVVQATNVSCVVQPGGEFDTPVERGTILCLKGRFVEMEVINMPSRGQGSNHVSYILGGELIRQNIIDLDATKIEDHLEKTLALMPLLWQKGRDPRSGDRLIGLVLQKDGYNYRRIGILEASSTLDRNVFATLAPASNPVPTTIRII
jgi:hypothetical protein